MAGGFFAFVVSAFAGDGFAFVELSGFAAGGFAFFVLSALLEGGFAGFVLLTLAADGFAGLALPALMGARLGAAELADPLVAGFTFAFATLSGFAGVDFGFVALSALLGGRFALAALSVAAAGRETRASVSAPVLPFVAVGAGFFGGSGLGPARSASSRTASVSDGRAARPLSSDVRLVGVGVPNCASQTARCGARRRGAVPPRRFVRRSRFRSLASSGQSTASPSPRSEARFGSSPATMSVSRSSPAGRSGSTSVPRPVTASMRHHRARESTSSPCAPAGSTEVNSAHSRYAATPEVSPRCDGNRSSMNASGSSTFASSQRSPGSALVRTSKCRCGVVARPVMPTRPRMVPAGTNRPERTRIEAVLRWAYTVYASTPPGSRWASTTFVP